ncbi:hypothetical protein H0H93_013648 [Arthromyces matolae]|nr:hypothetical protein H0H93_013648 [Arthromyces matolae]
MRRKSSAQNLLNSFKSSSPPPISVATNNATNLSFAAAAGASTPTSGSAKEFDVQSLYNDPTLASATSPQLGQGPSVEYLRDLVQKRIITLTYIRSIYEGRSHWFHTILISRADLEREFSNSNPDIRRRTNRFAILGMSLSNLLDINAPHDLFRTLTNTINEYDQTKDDGDKPKMPFPIDYYQTLLSLLDVISEVYNKISKILGPSPFAHSSQHMMGPLGLLSPHPGVSYILSGDNTPTANPNSTQQSTPSTQYYSPYSGPEDMSSSLWNIANPGAANGLNPGGTIASPPPPNLAASYSDSILKIDGKFKKITSVLLKELDVFARTAIKDELESLDPLLANLKVGPTKSESSIKGGGNRATYDPSKGL